MLAALVVVPLFLTLAGTASPQSLMTSRDLLALPQPPADHTVAYGPGPWRFGELSLPKGPGPHPVVVFIHGGCWHTPWALDHARSLCSAFVGEGLAVWNLEYRRLGDDGGGWPGTFEDVAAGADHLRVLAGRFPLDLGQVVAVGHSAGGHLALWLAGRHRLPVGSPLRGGDPLPLKGVVSLAGIPNLRDGARRQVCGHAIERLLGAPSPGWEERMALASPAELLPLGARQRQVCGDKDAIVPPDLAIAYEAVAQMKGDDVTSVVVAGAGHFELVNPASVAWPAVRAAVRSLLGLPVAAPVETR